MIRPSFALPALTVVMAGCNGVQSALDPQGPKAAEIALLGWLLFTMAALVMLVVLAGTWVAMRGRTRIRARFTTDRAVYVGGIAFPAIVLTGLLGYDVAFLRANRLEANTEPTLRIDVIGEQWWWRVAYVDPDGTRIPAANEIRIPAGEDIEFTLGASDVIHSFWVPALGGKVDMIPGRTTRLRLSADRPGTYRGQCAEYCGGPHGLMAIEVSAMPRSDFNAWLDLQRAPATAPPTETAIRGEVLFHASGCGSCHTIRGTEAASAIGPDLTHIGSRPSVGVDTLPLNEANLARFIADGQSIKPGNHMPPFRIFSDAELAALATYLAGLK